MSYATILPVSSSSPASSWQLADQRHVRAQTEPAAAGAGRVVVELDQLPLDEQWLIDRAVIHCTTAAAALRLYDGYVDPLQLLDGSERGGFDVSEYPNGLLVSPASRLVVEWSGVDDGAVGSIRLQARILRRV